MFSIIDSCILTYYCFPVSSADESAAGSCYKSLSPILPPRPLPCPPAHHSTNKLYNNIILQCSNTCSTLISNQLLQFSKNW